MYFWPSLQSKARASIVSLHRILCTLSLSIDAIDVDLLIDSHSTERQLTLVILLASIKLLKSLPIVDSNAVDYIISHSLLRIDLQQSTYLTVRLLGSLCPIMNFVLLIILSTGIPVIENSGLLINSS